MAIRPTNHLGLQSKLFDVSYLRRLSDRDLATTRLQSLSDMPEGYQQQEGSFRNDPLGYPLRSSQQIPIDFSKFENHTFFNSAEANVNAAFGAIINEFPFDGTRDEMVSFVDSLTGFEKYVYDSLPKSLGYLAFDETNYIVVADSRGSFEPGLANFADGRSSLDPGNKSYSVELFLRIPDGIDFDNYVVFQKLSSTGNGIGLYVSESSALSDVSKVIVGVSSGSYFLSASYDLPRGAFQHVTFQLDRSTDLNVVRILSGSTVVATSTSFNDIGSFGTAGQAVTIGSGSTHVLGESFAPVQTMTGAMDDLRVWSTIRASGDIKKTSIDTVYPTDDLLLLYRFNEPTGSYNSNNVVLDGSGNSLHARIVGFLESQRAASYGSTPLVRESFELSPVLFPAHEEVLDLNAGLLASASLYDANNPSMILKLIPRHYLLEASSVEGFEDEEAGTGDALTTNSAYPEIPGNAKIGSPQIISAFMFAMAKQYDEYKIFVDHFAKLLHVDYDTQDTVSDQLLLAFASQFGFDIPPAIFNSAEMQQYFSGEELTIDPRAARATLKTISSQILRRVLVNMPEIIRSKGTRHAIEAVMRCIGINPESSYRIREFGGAPVKDMTPTRRKMTEVRSVLDFSGSLASVGAANYQGFVSDSPWFATHPLSASRLEVGAPQAIGTFVSPNLYPPHGISDDPNDGLLTRGSWTVEGRYRFRGLTTGSHPDSQSLMRMHVTGDPFGSVNADRMPPIVNLVATRPDRKEDVPGSLDLFVRTYASSSTERNVLHLSLTDIDVFDGDAWYISFGRDAKTSLVSQPVTESYFIRAGKIQAGDRVLVMSTETLFNDPYEASPMTHLSPVLNASGAYLVIGDQSLQTGADYLGLVDTTWVTASLARTTGFTGQVGEVRFWSKLLEEREWLEHVRNPRSEGVIDPLVNYNFVQDRTGSFERLRVHLSTDQPVTSSDGSGQIELVEFSQQFDPVVASGFEASARVIKPIRYDFTMIEPKYDERSAENKVRIRGFLEESNVELYGGNTAPVYEIAASEAAQDDTRLSIEMSMVKGLDEDIVNILAGLDAIEKAIGPPEMQFTEHYPELDKIRRVYFQRLTGKINYEKFLEVFKWFDDSIEYFVQRLIPIKTDFLGVNFVVESHMLERAKTRYSHYRMYVAEDEKDRESDIVRELVAEVE